ncbi:tRNA dimethylallyltransferase [Striga asiatica]|uniref:tRNA dimethylallyltransferase n=1 Tax=Striga asiatica TaxID=4170 RepID=A0A5A7P2A8_STRAF|nr:tRNA dimethylallyltransferase [Striga asiatica]
MDVRVLLRVKVLSRATFRQAVGVSSVREELADHNSRRPLHGQWPGCDVSATARWGIGKLYVHGLPDRELCSPMNQRNFLQPQHMMALQFSIKSWRFLRSSYSSALNRSSFNSTQIDKQS